MIRKKQHALQEVVAGLKKQHALWKVAATEQNDAVAPMALTAGKAGKAGKAQTGL
jgi:hypothetical protein